MPKKNRATKEGKRLIRDLGRHAEFEGGSFFHSIPRRHPKGHKLKRRKP
mgnify:CR=1 FL=1|jgi:hypothetical protein